MATAGAMLPAMASAEETQVFFQYGGSFMGSNRAGEVFTDLSNSGGRGFNDGGQGWYIGAGLNDRPQPVGGDPH